MTDHLLIVADYSRSQGMEQLLYSGTVSGPIRHPYETVSLLAMPRGRARRRPSNDGPGPETVLRAPIRWPARLLGFGLVGSPGLDHFGVLAERSA